MFHTVHSSDFSHSPWGASGLPSECIVLVVERTDLINSCVVYRTPIGRLPAGVQWAFEALDSRPRQIGERLLALFAANNGTRMGNTWVRRSAVAETVI